MVTKISSYKMLSLVSIGPLDWTSDSKSNTLLCRCPDISLKLGIVLGRAGLECDHCNIGIFGDECKKCAEDEHWNRNYPDHLGYTGSIIHLKYTGLRCEYFTGE